MGVISTAMGCPILSITTDLSLLIKRKNLLFLRNPTTRFSMVQHLLSVLSRSRRHSYVFVCEEPSVSFPSGPPHCYLRPVDRSWHGELRGSACLPLVRQLPERRVTDGHLDDMVLHRQPIHLQHSLRGLSFIFIFHIGQALSKE